MCFVDDTEPIFQMTWRMEEDKTLVTREWLYTKILDASQKKYYGKLCGLVLAGGSGAGKSTFCKQLQEEKASSRKHTLLRNKMIASYICPNKKLCSGSYIVQFLHSIYSQLTESPALLRFQEQKESGEGFIRLLNTQKDM